MSDRGGKVECLEAELAGLRVRVDFLELERASTESQMSQLRELAQNSGESAKKSAHVDGNVVPVAANSAGREAQDRLTRIRCRSSCCACALLAMDARLLRWSVRMWLALLGVPYRQIDPNFP